MKNFILAALLVVGLQCVGIAIYKSVEVKKAHAATALEMRKTRISIAAAAQFAGIAAAPGGGLLTAVGIEKSMLRACR